MKPVQLTTSSDARSNAKPKRYRVAGARDEANSTKQAEDKSWSQPSQSVFNGVR